MNFEFASKIKGSAKATVLRNGKVIQESGKSDNLFTNQFFSGQNYYNYCVVGTGTQEPLPTMTQIPGGVANKSAESGPVRGIRQEGEFLVVTKTYTFVFAVGAVNAVIGCVGLVNSSLVTSTAMSILLLKDAQGNPITIPVTVEDQLIIEYTVEFKLPWKVTQTVTIDSVNYDISVMLTSNFRQKAGIDYNHPSLIFNFNYNYSALCSASGAGTYTAPASCNSVGSGAMTRAANTFQEGVVTGQNKVYDAANRKMSESGFLSMSGLQTFADNTVKFMQIGSSTSSSSSATYTAASALVVIECTPPIPKTSSHTLTLGFTCEIQG